MIAGAIPLPSIQRINASYFGASLRGWSRYSRLPNRPNTLFTAQSVKATFEYMLDPATKTPWTRSKGFVLDIQWWADNRLKVNDYWSKWIVT